MKTVVTTCGKGFIGSHFVEMLLEKGYRVIDFDKITYASNLDFKPKSPNYLFYQQDVKDLKSLPACDYIIHFAAESHVDRSIQDSDPFINSNILATHNLLQILKNNKLKNYELGWEYKEPILVHISTDEVFGDIETGFFKEEDVHNPSNPYAATKSAAECLVKAWGRTYNLNYRITRTTNNYGERQHAEKLIPRCIMACLKGEKIPIHGTGEYIRNFIYVKDNCEAILKVMENGKPRETYNISSDEEYSVLQIVEMILSKFGKSVNQNTVEFIQNRSGQDWRYGLDSVKIQRELGWKQTNKLSKVLDKMIEDYESRFDAKLI